MPFMITRIGGVGDFDAWKAMFDQDQPKARESALGWRLYRSAENTGEVFVQVEFASADDARGARERLVASGVLERFPDRTGPAIVDEVEAVTR